MKKLRIRGSFMKAMIFDLDCTLYDAEQYYSGAFKEISEYIYKKHKISKQRIYNKLMNIWKKKTSMYKYLFSDLLDFFNLSIELKNVINIFNNYDGKIELYPYTISTLNELRRRDYKMGIITDGNVERQKRKIKLLNISRFFDTIIFTDELGSPKPSVIPFRNVIDELKILPRESFYIGDNPIIDFKGAKKAGMKTIRILSGEFRNIAKNEYIDYEVNEIKELMKIVDVM